MRVGRPVRVLESALALAPIVVGWLRPVILLPASAVSGLTPRQLEAVLAHELAHVRRHDYLVNIVQTAIETLLFYHPAVHWVNARIRSQREVCCDELAVDACGDARTYARALAELAELRCTRQPMAVGLRGAGLLDRIRRILGLAPERRPAASRWLAGVLTVVVAASLAVGAYVAAKPIDGSAGREEVTREIIAKLCRSPIDSAAQRLKQMDEEQLTALLRFYEVYSLGPQESVRLVSAPFMPERLTYQRWAEPGPRVRASRTPNGVILHQQGEKLLLWGQHHGKPPNLAFQLRSVTELDRPHIEGDQQLLGRTLRADVVVRPGAPGHQVVGEFQTALEGIGWPVRLDLQRVERDVLIASGQYNYQPLPRWAAYLHGRSPAIDVVEIFGSRPRQELDRGGGGGGDFEEFLDWVGDYVGNPVVAEGITGVPESIQWRNGPRLQEPGKGRSDPLPPGEAALVLRHLTEQTGLTFREGTRPVPILFVESTEQSEPGEGTSAQPGHNADVEPENEREVGREEDGAGRRPEEDAAPPRLAFRLIADAPGPDTVEVPWPGDPDRTLHARRSIVLDERHVASARAVRSDPPDSWEIMLRLTPEGGAQFEAVTGANVGKRLGIFVDGECISAPIIRDRMVGGETVIEGRFTREEAERLADAIDPPDEQAEEGVTGEEERFRRLHPDATTWEPEAAVEGEPLELRVYPVAEFVIPYGPASGDAERAESVRERVRAFAHLLGRLVGQPVHEGPDATLDRSGLAVAGRANIVKAYLTRAEHEKIERFLHSLKADRNRQTMLSVAAAVLPRDALPGEPAAFKQAVAENLGLAAADFEASQRDGRIVCVSSVEVADWEPSRLARDAVWRATGRGMYPSARLRTVEGIPHMRALTTRPPGNGQVSVHLVASSPGSAVELFACDLILPDGGAAIILDHSPAGTMLARELLRSAGKGEDAGAELSLLVTVRPTMVVLGEEEVRVR
jgi:hypothetical protein